MSSLVKGSLLIAIGTVYKIILTILIDKYLAIQIGVENFGEYKFGVALVLVLGAFCSLGFPSSLVRTLAIQNEEGIKRKLITITAAMVVAASVATISVCLFLGKWFEFNPFFLAATLFYSLNLVFTGGVYSGLERPMLKVFLNDIFGFTIYLVFLLSFFAFNLNDKNIAAVYLAYAGVTCLVNLSFLRKYFIKFNIADLKSIAFQEFIKYSAPLFGISILIILSTHLDKLMLNYYVSKTDLGLYFAVFNVSNLLPLILVVLVFLYLPRTSKFLGDGKRNKAMLFNSYTSKWTMIAASIFFGILYFYTEDIIELLYSDEFVNASIILHILAFGQWINVSLGFTGQNLLALGDSKAQLKIRLISFAAGTILLFVLIKSLGNLGAAIAIFATLLLSNALQIIVLRTKHSFVGYRRQNIYAVMIVFVTGLAISQLHRTSFYTNSYFAISIILDFIFFILVLFLTGVLGKNDLRILKIVG